MSRIIKQRERVEEVYYRRDFTWKDDWGAGFSFACDKDGNPEDLLPEAQKNYEMCLRGEDENGRKILDDGVQEYRHGYIVPAVLLCDCGNEVDLEFSLTNTCDKCGTDYNMSGQRLAPRSQWGEETGESFADIEQGNLSCNASPEDIDRAFEGDW